MKKILSIAILFGLVQTVNSQNMDSLMTKRYLSCLDIEYNCSFLIPDFYNRGIMDSLNFTIAYWEKKCGENSLLFQTKTLIDIKEGLFNDKDINKTFFDKLVIYRKNDIYNSPYSTSHRGYFLYNINSELYDFLDTLSIELVKTSNLTATEDFLVNMYLDKSKLYELKSKKYSNTILSNYYTEYVDSILRIPEFTFSFYTGIFIPTQSASILGTKGIIGFGLGGIFYKNSIDFLLDFKFGSPKQSYEVLYQDSVITTDTYTGMYVGIEYGRALFMRNKSEYYLSGGVGGERITAVYRDDAIDQNPKFLWSPDFSIGLGYRYRYNYKNILSIQFRYQYLDFNNPSGSKLTGNTYTIRIIWKVSSNAMRKIMPNL